MILDTSLDNLTYFNNFIDNRLAADKEIDHALDIFFEKYNKLPNPVELKKFCFENGWQTGYWHIHKIGIKLYMIDYVLERELVKHDTFKDYPKIPEMLNVEIKFECYIEDIFRELEESGLKEYQKYEVMGVTRAQYRKWLKELKHFIWR